MAGNEIFTTNPLDLLLVNNFYVEIEKIPLFRYQVQSVAMPDITLAPTARHTPFLKINEVGDHCDIGNVSFEFLVDEELQNYRIIWYWMQGLGFPDKYEEFEEFMKGVYKRWGIREMQSEFQRGKFQFSDIGLIIISNQNNPTHKIKFFDAFPTSLTGLQMNVTDTSAEPVKATATFAFSGVEFAAI